ncbi:MAG: NifU family protein [Oscillospiraceae bacterium]|nr:NifU family protein [Oscillospiraceae bacterium]
MEEKICRYVKNVLAPKLQGDGGWIEFVSFQEGILTVIFRGECSKCLILHRCTEWIQEEIKRDLKLDVQLCAIRKKPYFQDV